MNDNIVSDKYYIDLENSYIYVGVDNDIKTIKDKNIIKLDPDKPYTIKQEFVTYNEKEHKFQKDVAP